MKIAGVELDECRFPRHIGLIMDGNSRWAKERGLPRLKGHHSGMQTLRRILELVDETPIKVVSLFIFSKENWKRPQDELDGLFNLFREFYKREFKTLKKRGVRIFHSGDLAGLAPDVIEKLAKMSAETVDGTGKWLNLAINYGGRDELVRACRRMAMAGTAPELIGEELLAASLDHPELGDIDLLIRTSGELRISNFCLWQLAYAELYFTDTYWPAFSDAELAEAIRAYQSRERRFGGREE